MTGSVTPDAPNTAVRAFSVSLPAPLDVAKSVGFLRRNGDDLLDRWDGTTLRRVLLVSGRPVPLAMVPTGDISRPRLSVTVHDTHHAVSEAHLQTAVLSQFVSAPEAWKKLCRSDRGLRDLDDKHPGVRLLTLTDPFYSLVRSISAQQVNLRWAVTLRGRLVHLLGTRYDIGESVVYRLDPARMAGQSVAELRSLQFSTRKAEYLITVAEAAASGQLEVADLAARPDSEVISQLMTLRGVGRWTAEWLLCRVLGRPVVVAGDLVVRKVVGRLYGTSQTPSEAETRRLCGHWGPGGAVAQQLILETL